MVEVLPNSWNDLDEQTKKSALYDDLMFASLKTTYPSADFSARDKLINRYATELNCTYCFSRVPANYLKGLPDICPFCKRRSEGLVLSPSHVAEWLAKHYTFTAAFIGMKARVYVYNEHDGYHSEKGAEAVLARESKILYGNSLTSQKLTNVRVNLIGNTVSDDVRLFPAVRRIENGIAINVRNGVVCLTGSRLEAVEIRSHDPKYMFSGVLPINYNPEATAYEILKFISEVSEGDLKLALSILEAFAYTLVPGYPIHKAILFQGTHNNGKSKTLDILKAMLGEENVAHMSLQRITYNRFALDWMQGKLANISPDLPTQEISDGGVFKALTGEDSQLIERKGDQTSGKLDNVAKLLFTANELPKSADNTTAFYDRWLILQFKHTFDGTIDPLPKLTTEQELSGLFNILIRYFVPTLMLRRCFIGAPVDINTTRDIYLKNSDNTRAFAEACLQYNPNADIPKVNFYATYLKYCDRYNLISKPEIAFWKGLRQICSYTEHRPERGGPAWVRGQALSVPQDAEGQPQNADIEMLLREDKYAAYSRFLEEKVPPEVCTRCTGITKVSPHSAITLEGGNIEEYMVKSLLSLCSLCNNDSEIGIVANNTTEISGEPSKIPVHLVMRCRSIITIPEFLTKTQKTTANMSTPLGILTTEIVNFRMNCSSPTFESTTYLSEIHTSTPSVSVTTLPLGCEASPVSVSYGDGACSPFGAAPSAPRQPTNATKPKPLDTGGAEVRCTVCGSSVGKLWDYMGRWMCTDCLNAKQHAGEDDTE